MKSSKGFFFSLDVLLFLFIITFGFVLVFSSLPGKVPRTQPILLADSMATFLASTPIEDIQSFITDTTITSFEPTIFEQAALYIEKGIAGQPNVFLKEGITLGATTILPKKYGLEVYIYKAGGTGNLADRYYNYAPRDLPQDADLLVSSKRVIYFYSKDVGRVIGPYIGEVRVW